MEYSVGNIGRVFLVKFSEDDEFVREIEGLCAREKVASALFHIIGGVKRADIVSGPKGETMPPEPILSKINKRSEILGIGTVIQSDGAPKAHLHAAVAKGDDIRVGCVRGDARTFLVSEVVLMELNGIDAKRIHDEESGFNLLRVFTPE